MAAREYEIRVSGIVPGSVLDELEGLDVTVEPVATVLHGRLPDEAAVHGVINRLLGLGLHLVDVRRLVDTEPPESDSPTEPSPG